MGHSPLILRPYGILVSGELHLGLEIERENGCILSIRPHAGPPDPFVISVPFVNAHSHLEYRGFQGRLNGLSYWDWIRELTRIKAEQSDVEVREDSLLAAKENRMTGVGLIGEHSDRPFSGEGMTRVGLKGVIFQEIITFFEQASTMEKLAAVQDRAEANRKAFEGAVFLNPHALYTVDSETLLERGRSGDRLSLHLAESVHERAFYERGTGPIAEFYQQFDVPFSQPETSPVEVAKSLNLIRSGVQLVHCCDLSDSDIETIAKTGASVAHCPRSNASLGCQEAPIFELLRAGVEVGLGMDSPASSGEIDMFAEMRAAIDAANRRGRPLSGEQVWNMSTSMGARTLGFADWDVTVGYGGPLVALASAQAESVDELIQTGTPNQVKWIE